MTRHGTTAPGQMVQDARPDYMRHPHQHYSPLYSPQEHCHRPQRLAAEAQVKHPAPLPAQTLSSQTVPAPAPIPALPTPCCTSHKQMTKYCTPCHSIAAIDHRRLAAELPALPPAETRSSLISPAPAPMTPCPHPPAGPQRAPPRSARQLCKHLPRKLKPCYHLKSSYLRA